MRKKGIPKNKKLKVQGIRFLYKEMSLFVIMVELFTGKFKILAKIRQNLHILEGWTRKDKLDCGHIVYVVKMHYFFTKNFFFTGLLVMMSK